MTTTPSGLERLKEYFTVEESEKAFQFSCKKCAKAWELKKGGEQHPGNILHLLNHAYGHKK